MNRKGAMEMSMGAIVTIVLVVTVLVLGLVLVQKIFGAGTDAVEGISDAMQDEISKLFADENKKLIVYPSDRSFDLKRGDSPKGFAFSVRNNDVEERSYTYTVLASDVSRCGSAFGESQANQMLIGGTGSFSLGPGSKLDLPRLVKFVVPESAPPCTLTYELDIPGLQSADVFVTIK